MPSRSRSQPFTRARHDEKLRLTTFPFILVTAWLSAVGCAGPQVYVPFEQPSKLSAEARWQTLQDVARREGWDVVESNHAGYVIVAYSDPTGIPGVRDRIKVELFGDRTVVETRSEIADQGRWQTIAARCAKYGFTREKLLAAQLEDAQANPATSPQGLDLAGRWCRPSRDGLARTLCGGSSKRR